MKITEYENEAALDLLAELIEPATVIFSDTKIRDMITGNGSKLDLIKYIIKNHQQAIITILAALDGVPVAEYHANILKMTNTLLAIFNDKEMIDFFTSAAPKTDQTLSGSAMENTEASGK